MKARALYGIVVVVRIVTMVWAFFHLPDRIATHFGASGAANGWGTRGGYLAIDIITSAAVVLGLPMLVGALTRGSGAGINVPHKEYWLRPENRPAFQHRLTTDMLLISAATGLLLSWVDVEIVRANAVPTPVMGGDTWVVGALFVILVVGYSIWMGTGRYAIPAGQRTGSLV